MERAYFSVIPAKVRYDKELPDKAKLLYGELTALCNEKGYCWATNEYFASLYSCNIRTIQRLISILENKGYIRVEVLKLGWKTERRIYIDTVLTTKQEDKIVLVDMDKNSIVEGDKNVMVEKDIIDILEVDNNVMVEGDKNVMVDRDKNVTQNNKGFNNTLINKTINNTRDKKNVQLEEEFEILWSMYPRKDGKQQAKNSYFKARKEKTTYEQVGKGLKRFIEALKERGTQKEFIPMGSTWFNQRRWEDEYTITATKKVSSYMGYVESLLESEENEFIGNSQDTYDDQPYISQ